MKKCWASSLGACGKSSREHFVSKGIFKGRELRVKGFPWCKDEFASVGIESITSKVLCRRHNGLLSEVDAAGIHAFNVFDKAAELTVQKASVATTPTLIIDEIDGALLERWFLKTFINLTYRTPFLLGTMGEQPGVPPRYLVDVAFGAAPFSYFMGLYALVADGQSQESRGEVSFTPFIKDGYASMGLFSFRGVDFLLSLIPSSSPPPESLDAIDLGGLPAHLLHAKLRYRVPRIGLSHGDTEHHRIDISWPRIPWMPIVEAKKLDGEGRLSERVWTEYGWYAPTGKGIA